MFFKKSSLKAEIDNPETIIGKGVYLEAIIMKGDDSVRIEGTFKGNIQINGTLSLGSEGSITGDIQANVFYVAGEVNGNITCATQLHFTPTAKVDGDVKTSSLVVDEGSQVNGRYVVGANRLGPQNISTSGEKLRLTGGEEDNTETNKKN